MPKNAPALSEAESGRSVRNGELAQNAKATRKSEKKSEKKKSKKDKQHSKADSKVASKAEAQSVDEPSQGKLSFESNMEREEVAVYLEAIVAGLRKGSVHFRQGDDSLDLSPAERVEFGVKVASKSGKQRLEFEINWRTDEPDDLTIVSG